MAIRFKLRTDGRVAEGARLESVLWDKTHTRVRIPLCPPSAYALRATERLAISEEMRYSQEGFEPDVRVRQF